MDNMIISGAQPAYAPAWLNAAISTVGTRALAPVNGRIGGEVCPQTAAAVQLTTGPDMPAPQAKHRNQDFASTGLAASTGDVRFVKVPPGSHAKRRTG